MRKSFVLTGLSLVLSLVFISCTSTGSKNIDPSKAADKLAPLVSLADKPREGVYYSLFVRSFADSNGDGIGDFNGITERLDYLNDGKDETTSDLGITGIWLLPIYPSETYHGYNVDDYYAVNEQYGTMEDFENLVKEAKKRGISIILDMTFNHSSTYTDWFIDSRKKDSPYRDWYRWAEDGDKRYNLDQQIWKHDVWHKTKNGDYYAGIFDGGMPDFNHDNMELRNELKKISKFWLDKGVAGFRYDAAGHVYNAAKLPAGQDSMSNGVAFWKDIISYDRSVNPDCYTVGEVWEPTPVRAAYGAGLYSTFHFDLGTKISDVVKYGDDGNNNLANSWYEDCASYAKSNPDYIDAPFLSNHDQNRIAGQLKLNSEKIKLAAAMYILGEGIPFIYYGEEIGMNGGTNDPDRRTPLMWDADGKDSMQPTWRGTLSSTYNRKTVPVKKQEKDADSILSYYKRLIRVKTAHAALLRGRLKPVNTDTKGISSWAMVSSEETVLVMHNYKNEAITLTVPEDFADYKLIFHSGAVKTENQLVIPPLTSVVLGK